MPKKTDTEQIRRENRKNILDYLRIHGPVARIELGQELGLSPATITAITSDLVREHRLNELPVAAPASAKRGRPRVLVDLNADAINVIGLRLTTNEIRVILGDQKGRIVNEKATKLQTLELSETALIATIKELIDDFLRSLNSRFAPKAIGVAIQGAVNGRLGEIVWSPAFSCRHIQIQQPLERNFGVPVTVVNDANCLATAMWHKAEYRQLNDFAVIEFDNGVGMGIIIDGELYFGHNGAAAEFGHTKYIPHGQPCLCGKKGCIEAYVSDYALFREAEKFMTLPVGERLHPSEESMKRIVAETIAGNPDLKRVFHQAGEALGTGLANIIALTSPEKIIISGAGVRAYDLMAEGIKKGLHDSLVSELANQTKIDVVDWRNDIIVSGALVLALQKLD